MGWPFAGIPSGYVTSHSGQLSLLLSAGREMSTGQSQFCVAGKVTVGLVSTGHASQSLWYIHLRAQWRKEGRWAPRLHSCKEYGTLYLVTVILFWAMLYEQLRVGPFDAAAVKVAPAFSVPHDAQLIALRDLSMFSIFNSSEISCLFINSVWWQQPAIHTTDLLIARDVIVSSLRPNLALAFTLAVKVMALALCRMACWRPC